MEEDEGILHDVSIEIAKGEELSAIVSSDELSAVPEGEVHAFVEWHQRPVQIVLSYPPGVSQRTEGGGEERTRSTSINSIISRVAQVCFGFGSC